MVDYDTFLKWAEDKFGEKNIQFAKGGEEICVPTPFADDSKHHLWMNPSGGKSKNPENGSYRCWYTDRSGSLVSLVSELDGINWDEAQELICNQISLRNLEKKVNEMFQIKENQPIIHSNKGRISLPDDTHLIVDLPDNDIMKNIAIEYLTKRKIPVDNLCVCKSGNYGNRIIIPYYDINNNLIWYNARTLSSKKYIIRYMKPDVSVESGLSQENVLYIKKYPVSNQKIFITEGEFDAISLYVCGYFSAACGGKHLTNSQIDLIRDYIPVLAFDSDKHGKKALLETGMNLMNFGFKDIFYIRPPQEYKDWNNFLINHNENIVKEYISKYIKKYTSWTNDQLQLKDI